MNTEFTEFDEQAASKRQALLNYWRAYAQYIAGKETMGVVDGCAAAAFRAGASLSDLDTSTVRRMVEMAIERGGSCWRGNDGGFYSCPADIVPQVSAICFYLD